MNELRLHNNDFLTENNVKGYYNLDYTGYNNTGNPDYLNKLKNTFNNENDTILLESVKKVINILLSDLPLLIKNEDKKTFNVMCIPRSKELKSYSRKQLYFMLSVKIAILVINNNQLYDSVNGLSRIKNTHTTHFRNLVRNYNNDGPAPYRGITRDTCEIKEEMVRDKSIILIDDVYTRNVGIAEDCIQCLYDFGAKEVIFYSIAKTRGIR